MAVFAGGHSFVFEDHLDLFIAAFSSLFQNIAYPDPSYQTIKELVAENKLTGIKALPAESRPREKVVSHGILSLSDAEVLALMIGSGTSGTSAIELAARLLHSKNDQLERLKDSTLAELCNIHGMGMAKSTALLAAIEIGRRMS